MTILKISKKTLSIIGASIVCTTVACNNENHGLRTPNSASNSKGIQTYIDSCSLLYSLAINETKNGVDKETVKAKYAGNIVRFHSLFSKSFDSLTYEYTSKRISQVQYDSIMKSIDLKTVAQRSEELSQLGVSIELK